MKLNTAQKLWPRESAIQRAKALRESGKTIVFTNGCFDILHAGHVQYLNEAAALGHFFIVGVNTDASVQRLDKSPARPLQSQESRAKVMASLGFVDAVVLFDEDTPEALIREINPHVLVKGADYSIDQIAGAPFVLSQGGKVKTIALLPGFSTTSIEKKILRAHGLDQ
jgi:rfaE bifunctional protein nucleotidyltransferase chain/domain